MVFNNLRTLVGIRNGPEDLLDESWDISFSISFADVWKNVEAVRYRCFKVIFIWSIGMGYGAC